MLFKDIKKSDVISYFLKKAIIQLIFCFILGIEKLQVLGLGFERKINTFVKQMKKEMPKLATRQASQKTLEVINKSIPFTLGGSADLTGSNLTKTNGMKSKRIAARTITKKMLRSKPHCISSQRLQRRR